jgi:hypothetical protein
MTEALVMGSSNDCCNINNLCVSFFAEGDLRTTMRWCLNALHTLCSIGGLGDHHPQKDGKNQQRAFVVEYRYFIHTNAFIFSNPW